MRGFGIVVMFSVMVGGADARPAAGQERPKILILHDMEGLSGEDDWRMFMHDHPEQYREGQRLLVNDVNAVIGGLFAGGAKAVDIVDGHGSGNQEPDIPLERLDPRAKMVYRDKPFDQYTDLVEPGAYDGVVTVGMHAKTGSGGFASHTLAIGTEVWMNGMSLCEAELTAYSWGRAGVPLILATGDDHLQKNLQTLPWIQFVVTKYATSASTVRLRPTDSVHAEMHDAAKAAVQQLARMRPATMSTPVRAMVKAVHPASLTMLDGFPGVNYKDNSISFTADDFKTAYDGVRAVLRAASRGYPNVMMETIQRAPNAVELGRQWREDLFMRWLDVESGRWKAPEPRPAMGPAKRYFGAN